VGIDCLTFDFQFTGIALGAGATAPISLFDPLAEVTFRRVTRSFEDEQHDYVRCIPAIAPRRAQIQDVSTKVPAARICCYR